MLERLWFASWQGAIALGGVWLICRFAKRLPASVKVWLWRLAMLKTALTLFLPAPTLHILPAEKVAKVEAAPVMQIDAEIPSLADLPLEGYDPSYLQQVSVELEPAKAAPQKAPDPKPSPVLADLWIAGAVGLFVLAFIGLARAAKSARQTNPVVDRNALLTADEAAARARLNRTPKVRAFEQPGSPYVTGVVRPFVAIPQTLIQNLADLKLALLHEFAHLRRGDLPWSFAMSVLRALFWFHPLAWLAEREHRLQSEVACDAFVVESSGNRRDYALALVRLAVLGSGDMRAAATLGAVGSRRALHRRLSEMSKPLYRRLSFRAAMAVALPVAVLLVPIQLAARQGAPEKTPAPPAPSSSAPAIAPVPPAVDDAKPAVAPPAPVKAQLKSELATLKVLQAQKMKKLSPEQRAQVQAELKKAIDELTRALNEELPKALEEAKRELDGAQKQIDSKELHRQIEQSVRQGMEAARKALEQLSGDGEFSTELFTDPTNIATDGKPMVIRSKDGKTIEVRVNQMMPLPPHKEKDGQQIEIRSKILSDDDSVPMIVQTTPDKNGQIKTEVKIAKRHGGEPFIVQTVPGTKGEFKTELKVDGHSIVVPDVNIKFKELMPDVRTFTIPDPMSSVEVQKMLQLAKDRSLELRYYNQAQGKGAYKLAPDANLHYFYSGKPLSTKERKRLAEIDKKIAELMKERSKLNKDQYRLLLQSTPWINEARPAQAPKAADPAAPAVAAPKPAAPPVEPPAKTGGDPQEEQTIRVPILSDLPIIGRLFTNMINGIS